MALHTYSSSAYNAALTFNFCAIQNFCFFIRKFNHTILQLLKMQLGRFLFVPQVSCHSLYRIQICPFVLHQKVHSLILHCCFSVLACVKHVHGMHIKISFSSESKLCMVFYSSHHFLSKYRRTLEKTSQVFISQSRYIVNCTAFSHSSMLLKLRHCQGAFT